MTNEEAIEELKSLCPETCCYYRDKWCEEIKVCSYRDAIDLAIEALEKHMPKKPILKSGTTLLHVNKGDKPHEIEFNKWVDWVCPSCGWFVGQRYNANQSHPHDQRKSNFCNECGQAIDWSEEE